MCLSLYAFRHMETLQIQQILKELNPNYLHHKYLIAVSGGVDSMVLLHIAITLGLQVEVAHINYHLRGEDSNLDQSLVENFCKQHNLVLHVYEVSDLDQKPDHSIQNWARELRYTYFFGIMKQRNLDQLMTAHHAHDNVETFVINLSKAAGLKGLSGIPKKTKQIVRPLLTFSKNGLYNFAKSYNVPFREDYSNKKDDYLRNKIRLHITPELEKLNPSFLENFNQSIEILNDAKDFIQEQIDKIILETSYREGEKIIFDKKILVQHKPFVHYEIFSRYGFHNKEEIAKFWTSTTGSQFYSNGCVLLINREELIVYPKNEEKSEEEIIILDSAVTDRILNIKNILPQENISFSWSFDKDKLDFPLYLRKKKTGDVFHPKGLKGKKKVSKFFKDEKLSILAKESTWLLCDATDTILGIIPLRQDGRKSATEHTKNYFHIINQKDNEV